MYVIAALLYPGGSQIDKYSKGFSWTNNYWCNLLNKEALNGEHNPSRPVALAGTLILCLSIAVFWFYFPLQMKFERISRSVMQISGVVSMAFALFLFTDFHDTVINIAGIFGIIALAGTYIGLYSCKWRKLFWFGIVNLILVILNNYVYYTKGLIVYLPIIQKFSFISFLLWICLIDIRMYKHSRLKVIN
jgi:hypothetical protein